MKALLKSGIGIKLFSCAALLTLIILSGCDKDPIPTAEELYLKKLTSSWKIKSATVDSKDVLNHFNGLALQINGDYTYQVTNPVTGLWPASGTFRLEQVGDVNFNIRRDDGVLINVSVLSDTELKLKFQYTVPANGRVSGVSGQYEFSFNK